MKVLFVCCFKDDNLVDKTKGALQSTNTANTTAIYILEASVQPNYKGGDETCSKFWFGCVSILLEFFLLK